MVIMGIRRELLNRSLLQESREFTLGVVDGYKASVSASLEKAIHRIPVLLPGKSHGWRNLVGCSPWGLEESDMTE